MSARVSWFPCRPSPDPEPGPVPELLLLMPSQQKIITILDMRDSPWVDGPGRTTLETALRIDPQRYRILIAGFTGGRQQTGEYLHEADRLGLTVIRLEEKGSLDLGVVRQVLHEIDRHAVDIVHTHEFRSNLIGLICAWRRGLPIVTTSHGWIANNLKGQIRVILDKLILHFFDHIITVSRKIQGQLRAWGIRPSRITTLSNAVAFEKFDQPLAPPGLRAELGLSAETVLVANIGRLSPEKGQFEFIRAAAVVLQEFSDMRFLVIGTGPDDAALRELARQLGITDKVMFLGYRKDMSRIYAGIDLVVQSSFTEGMPNVILEAAAMRVPVIATQVGGTGEIIEDGVTGRLIQPGVTADLSGAILDFLGHRQRYRDWASLAGTVVRQRFSYAQRTAVMAGIYDMLAEKRSRM